MSKDALSALIDGECTGPELDRLLDEMDRTPELARQWSRMVLAREARAGTGIGRQQPCICAGVMDRLGAADEHPKVVDLVVRKAMTDAARPAPSRMKTFWKPAVGFAAAASMGAAAVLLVQPQQAVEGAPGFEMPLAAASFSGTQPVGFGIHGVSNPATDSEEQYRRMLREYMMDHSHSIAGEGMGSTIGFTRIVAHTDEDRRQNDESH